MSSPNFLVALKRVLKARHLTYRDLANELGLSESGVKKMLTANDLSLGRLLQICEWLGVPAAEIVSLAERDEVHEVELSDEQSHALAADPALFRIFWRLTEREAGPDIIATEGLSESEWRKKLLKLETLDLLRITEEGHVHLKHRGTYRWQRGNPLVDRLNQDWSRITLDRALAARDELSLYRLSSLPLTEDSLRDLLARLNEVVDEFTRRSRREELTRPRTKLKPFSLLVAGVAKGFLDLDLEEN